MIINLNFLRIPLHGLYYVDKINEYHGLDSEKLKVFKGEYDEEAINNIVKAVEWATQNPDYDFLSLDTDLKFNNSEIYQYLCKLNESLKQL